MADATVTQGRREEPLAVAPDAARRGTPHVAIEVSRPLALLWAGFIAAVVAFLAFGTVRIGAGNWIGLHMSVRRIWARFTRFLTEEGASAALIFGVTAAAVLALLGAAVVLWLAFSLKDLPGDLTADDIPGQ